MIGSKPFNRPADQLRHGDALPSRDFVQGIDLFPPQEDRGPFQHDAYHMAFNVYVKLEG